MSTLCPINHVTVFKRKNGTFYANEAVSSSAQIVKKKLNTFNSVAYNTGLAYGASNGKTELYKLGATTTANILNRKQDIGVFDKSWRCCLRRLNP